MRKLSQKITSSKNIIDLVKGHFILVLCFLGMLSACGASDFAQNNMEKDTVGPFGEKKDYIISPPFEGVLLENGRPLANTIIIRSTSYNAIGDKWENETFQTDDNGYFNIPEKVVKMRLSFLSQFVAYTKLYAGVEDDEKLFWYSNTMNSSSTDLYEQFLNEKPIGFVCELTNEEIIKTNRFSGFVAKCYWDNFPK